MGRYNDSFITEVVSRTDITDLIGSYVTLQKRGGRLIGLCPFHSEKTPSFNVSQDKQTYYCFGCHAGGGVISFVENIEHLGFKETIEFLAERAGIPLPADDSSDIGPSPTEKIAAINRDAARHFYANLSSKDAAPALEYIKKRGISPEMVKNFGLGYAKDSWDDLIHALRAKGYTDRDMLEAGLVKMGKNGSGIYDTYRSRLMFPVIDVRGRVIGFSGRIIGDGEPKYMNSPENVLFRKRDNLFALNLAKKSKLGYIILCEGNVDVVSLHQAGFDCAVASLGTALTSDQARLISRYTHEVILSYDSDNAGKNASEKAIGILQELDIKVRVLQVTGAKDPDEFIKKYGRDAFANLIEKSENRMDFRLRALEEKYDLSIDEQKVDFLRAAAELLAGVPGEIEREVYASKTAQRAEISLPVLIDEINRLRQKKQKNIRRQENDIAVSPRKIPGAITYENKEISAAEEELIRICYTEPDALKSLGITAEAFSNSLLRRYYDAAKTRLDSGTPLSIDIISEEFTPQEISHLTRIINRPAVMANSEASARDCISRMENEKKFASAVDDPMAFAALLRTTKGYGDKH